MIIEKPDSIDTRKTGGQVFCFAFRVKRIIFHILHSTIQHLIVTIKMIVENSRINEWIDLRWSEG